MSDIINNAIESALASETVERLSAPFLERPSAVPERPVPKPADASAPSFPLPVSRQSSGNIDTLDMPVDTGSSMFMDDDSTAFTMGVENLTINPIQSSGSAAEIESSYLDKATGKIFGFEKYYNKATGTISTKGPNMGLFGAPPILGAVMTGVSKFIQAKQDEAARGASEGKKNYGIIQVNGQTVAVVDGKLYGNLPQNMHYADVKRAVLDEISKGVPNDFAGGYKVATPDDVYPTAPPIVPDTDAPNVPDFDESDGGYSPGGTGRGRTDYQGGYQGFEEPEVPSFADEYYDYSPPAMEDPYDEPSFDWSDFSFDWSFADGGRVGLNQGGQAGMQPAGFVGGPPEQYSDAMTVADTEKTKVENGTFIINAPAVEFAGSEDIRKMVIDAYGVAREKGLDIGRVDRKIYEESVDVALSKGEVVVPPALVKIIGLDKLQKINNRGKKEVGRRQEQAASEGGFINGYADGDVVEGGYYGGIQALNSAYSQFKNRFSSPKSARKTSDKIIQNLPAEDVLALLMMGEASILGDEGMRGVAHVAVNRSNSDYLDFAKQGTIYDVATKKTGSGIYQFNAFEPTTFRRVLKDITQTDYGRKKYESIRNDAEEILYGIQDDFTQGSLFFWNPETSTDASFKQKVKSGDWVPMGETRTKSAYHQYLAPRP